MSKVIILHGWQGSPEGNWFPWLKSELEKEGIEVTVPALPKPDYPICSEWVKTIAEAVGTPDVKIVLIGHSLGVSAILRYLEGLQEGQTIKAAYLVAGFAETLGIHEHDQAFFTPPLDFKKIKSHCQKFVAFASDNDPYVPIAQAHLLRDKLNAELIIVPHAGHFNLDAGYKEFPLLLEAIRINKSNLTVS